MSIAIEEMGKVRWIWLDRVKKRNAFDAALADGLRDALGQADTDEGVHVVVVAARGPIFSAGADLSLFLAMGDADAQVDPSDARVGQIWRAVHAMRKPVLAQVQGAAVGMGVTVLPHFDGVYAGKSATFTLPFVRLGLVQELASSWTLPRAIGHQRAMEWITSARPLDAQTAERWGLVTRAFEDEDLHDEVAALAQEMAVAPLPALIEAKHLLRFGAEHALDATAAEEDRVLAERYGSPENVAAVQAVMARMKS